MYVVNYDYEFSYSYYKFFKLYLFENIHIINWSLTVRIGKNQVDTIVTNFRSFLAF